MPMRVRAAGLVLILLGSSLAVASAAAGADATFDQEFSQSGSVMDGVDAADATPEHRADDGAGSPLALATLTPELLATSAAAPVPSTMEPNGLGSDRARILLQSLTIPGWGQATLGRNTAAAVFGLIEAGIWVSFISFKAQESMRADSYVRTAGLYAGIDLKGRDESFRRVVGQYPSSADYNEFVVYRDAANLYYGDPAKFDEYVQQHSLTGKDSWAWQGPDSYTAYQEQRQASQRAGLRANTALGLAIANRIVSALHAARYAGQPSSHALRLELLPHDEDPSGTRLALTTRF